MLALTFFFLFNINFFFLILQNSFCEINKCQNDGVCRPDFTTDTGVCECGFYSGRLCEIYGELMSYLGMIDKRF